MKKVVDYATSYQKETSEKQSHSEQTAIKVKKVSSLQQAGPISGAINLSRVVPMTKMATIPVYDGTSGLIEEAEKSIAEL